ncbi:hypothetical protein CC1G_06260 [Coprinopsis cinerea okayama7|uniref:Methyltransferase-domain-containing protein n=1 Tax=Coprinopsis cinerea (strain Okayama-7 / 130 / ATCC MYA-4618 / FGSC 9003) TaxID=240176 RepID=A8NT90_COPC7|nr:hypothetical protein CC1G_06260 [Coprinopsis cinerea okayama7\|eukprot:XP_001836175.2 hypothetical protein CC1G_06260 [Coprinopsis cinerea okayama7\
MNPNFPQNLDIKPSTSSENVAGDRFGIDAQQDAIQTYGIAGRVWEAAYAMNTYLNPTSSWVFDPPPLTKNKSTPLAIVELGSGTGIVASVIATALQPGDLLIATDLPDVCPLLEHNLRDPIDQGNVVVEPLAWGNSHHAESLRKLILNKRPSPGLNHIICSDLVYFPELLAPLLRSLIHLTSPEFHSHAQSPTVTISYMLRSLTKETPFWSAFGLWFTFVPVFVKERDDSEWQPIGSILGEDPTYIFHAKRRPESYTWVIPDSDQDLLAGVGAGGSPSRKWDTTFESLLFLSMNTS